MGKKYKKRIDILNAPRMSSKDSPKSSFKEHLKSIDSDLIDESKSSPKESFKSKNVDLTFFNNGLRCCLLGKLCKDNRCKYFHPTKFCRKKKCTYELCAFKHDTLRGLSHRHPLSNEESVDKAIYFKIDSNNLKSVENFLILNDKEIILISSIVELYPIGFTHYYFREFDNFEDITNYVTNCNLFNSSKYENVIILPKKKPLVVTKLFMDDLNDLRYVINIKSNNIEDMKLESKLYIYPNSTLASKLKCSTNYIFTKKILRRLNIFLEEEMNRIFTNIYPTGTYNIGCILPDVINENILGLVGYGIKMEITLFKILVYLMYI